MVVMTSNESEKDELLYRSYREVVGLDSYIQETAQRSLLASSFLILAGATVFGGTLFLAKGASKGSSLLNADYFVFFAFVALVLLGTFFTLIAIFPSFNVPEDWKETLPGEPKSMYFGFLIRQMPLKEWTEYLSSVSYDDLLSKSIRDLSYETHLISEKIESRRKKIRISISSYAASSVALILMILVLIVYVSYYVL